MHPQIRRAVPGACPICGMALEPLEPTLEEGANPKLADMTRRVWIGALLSGPSFLLAMGSEIFGWNIVPMNVLPWV